MTSRKGLVGADRPLRLNFGKSGLEVAFTDYQVKMLDILWASEEHLSSSQIWSKVVDEKKYPSRASVIFTLNWMVKQGIVDCEDITGKGGRYGTYQAKFGPQELWVWLAERVMEKLVEESGMSGLFG